MCDIVVRLEGVFPDALDAFQSAHRKIDQANTLRHEAAQEIRQVVARLRSEGLTMRDISALLGITPQRVSQLTASPSAS
jgi:predicted XRE-type DNA-binding protein